MLRRQFESPDDATALGRAVVLDYLRASGADEKKWAAEAKLDLPVNKSIQSPFSNPCFLAPVSAKLFCQVWIGPNVSMTPYTTGRLGLLDPLFEIPLLPSESAIVAGDRARRRFCEFAAHRLAVPPDALHVAHVDDITDPCVPF